MDRPEQLELFPSAPAPLAPPPAPAPTPAAPPKPVPDERAELQRLGEALALRIYKKTGKKIALTIHSNRVSMLSMKPSTCGNLLKVRMHKMFLTAPEPLQNALIEWVRHPKSKHANAAIAQFLREHRPEQPPPQKRRLHLYPRGKYFNLTELYADVNATHFNNAVQAHITWGHYPAAHGKRSLRMGSYSQQGNVIRIHPSLDQDWVPRFFVRYIVFHEMLHAAMPTSNSPTGRRRIHPPEFKAREAAYPEFDAAKQWIAENLNRLLKRPKRGTHS